VRTPALQPRLVESYGRLPLAFEANRGQTDPQVRFLSRGHGYTMFLTANQAVIALRKPAWKGTASAVPIQGLRTDWALAPEAGVLPTTTDNGVRTAALPFGPLIQNPKSQIENLPALSPEPPTPTVLRLKLVGANPNARVTGLQELPGRSNYFIGNDPKKWRTNVPNYAKVEYQDVYPGIDLVYYGKKSEVRSQKSAAAGTGLATGQAGLEFDFVVAPGADPRVIALAVETGNPKLENRNAKLDANGDLMISTDAGDVRFHKPVVYQPTTDNGLLTTDYINPKSQIANPKSVDGRFLLLASNRIGFEVRGYDRTKPLVIDPVLTYSTYLGGTNGDGGGGIAVDASGSAYVAGGTISTDFPTVNPAQGAHAGGSYDAFVAKLSAAGDALVYSTYLGGTGWDSSGPIGVDSFGSAYVTGNTTSTDFPTVNPAQAVYAGGPYDGFVAKLSAGGDALVYSTYLGGTSHDMANDIAVDASGSAYVTGWTGSFDFPTANPFQPANHGPGHDAFVTKLDASGSALAYSTYLGGTTGHDRGYGIAVDSSNNVYVTGTTESTDFPTANPFQSGNAGAGDAFVTKLSASGAALGYSTYLGGTSADQPWDIAVDASGSAYVTGWTFSGDFPTANPFQPANAGAGDAFVTKLDASGSALAYSSYLGGTSHDRGYVIAVDSSNNAYASGITESTDFPTANPLQAFNAGWPDAFLTKLNAAGSGLLFSTYVGGSGYEEAHGIAVDSASNAYVTGWTNSYDFPTANPFQAANAGMDMFVAKIDPRVFAAEVQPPIAADGSSVFNARRGVVPVRFTLTADGEPTCDLYPATIALLRTGGQTPIPINPDNFIAPSEDGSSFRITDCQYHYNLRTSSLGTGTYLVQIKIGGVVVGSATFGLK
jgi:hypothetical protein